MKNLLMKKFSAPIAIALSMVIILGFMFAPVGCQLTPQQQQRLQAISVPVTALGLQWAKAEGVIEDGDRITIQRGVAVLVSPGDAETKIYQLAEIGLTDAVNRGLFHEGQTAEIDGSKVLITEEPVPLLNP